MCMWCVRESVIYKCGSCILCVWHCQCPSYSLHYKQWMHLLRSGVFIDESNEYPQNHTFSMCNMAPCISSLVCVVCILCSWPNFNPLPSPWFPSIIPIGYVVVSIQWKETCMHVYLHWTQEWAFWNGSHWKNVKKNWRSNSGQLTRCVRCCVIAWIQEYFPITCAMHVYRHVRFGCKTVEFDKSYHGPWANEMQVQVDMWVVLYLCCFVVAWEVVFRSVCFSWLLSDPQTDCIIVQWSIIQVVTMGSLMSLVLSL